MFSRQKIIYPPRPRWIIGWSKIADGSALDLLKTFEKLPSSEFWRDLEHNSKWILGDVEEVRIKCLFNHFLRIFLEETCGSACFWPLPPMLGDGQSWDLFKLYLLVREKGGCETVSANALWDSVAEESGLGSGVGSAVKLVYTKYLDALHNCLQRIIKDKDLKGGLQGSLMELEAEFRGISSEIIKQKKKDGEFLYLDLEKSPLNNDNEVGSSAGSGEGNNSVGNMRNDSDVEANLISDSSVSTEEVYSRKRKRESHRNMLDWVAEVATDPCDPKVGSLPDRSKWKSYGTEQLWKQVLLAREAMFLKTNAILSTEQSVSNWLKQKMHPSMYDDHTGSERLRCSQRLISAKESLALSSKVRACSESQSASHSDLEDHTGKDSESLSGDSFLGVFGDNHHRKRIPVGPLFQAHVPDWTGETYESNFRWLGTRVWPLESSERNKYVIERERIGKGRQDSCGCRNPNSIECVRFHVNEKRTRLKLELGLAFYRWKFDKMGEEVAVSWTEQEERKFKEVIMSNPPSLGKSFWEEIVKSFPSRRTEDLVNYYFNVFLLRHRGYQNRSTPSDVDSDDEESQFGSLGNNGCVYEAGKSPGSIFHTPKKSHLNFR
ncbi:hypothetical protein NMG60_11022831 [Bertholletia excelsa]